MSWSVTLVLKNGVYLLGLIVTIFFWQQFVCKHILGTLSILSDETLGEVIHPACAKSSGSRNTI